MTCAALLAAKQMLLLLLLLLLLHILPAGQSKFSLSAQK
jgi:hypothetical protein